jgi:predicted polyphosphate/ATP-dependent NAD kinase
VSYLPDLYGIVERAAGPHPLLPIVPLEMPVVGHASDSSEAAARLRDQKAAVIVTLGGDGTNRAVAKGCGDVPLVPISTGTNNVFPLMIEGTLAGLAAGFVATGAVGNRPERARVIRRAPRLEVYIDGSMRDIALIDVVRSAQAWIGARALWDPSHLRELVVSRITTGAVGIAGIGGALFPQACETCAGAWVAVGHQLDAQTRVAIPLAPGMIRTIPVTDAALVHPGEGVTLAAGPCTIALDGEREIELLNSKSAITVELNAQGPRVIDVEAALQVGAAAGAFRSLKAT